DRREVISRKTGDISLSGKPHPWAQQAKGAHDQLSTQIGALLAEHHVASASELNGYLENLKKSWLSHLVRAHGSSSNAHVRPARRLLLEGLSDTQGGADVKYVVSRVSHQMDIPRGFYSNAFEAIPAANATPAWAHHRPRATVLLQGVVVEDQDPLGTGAYAAP